MEDREELLTGVEREEFLAFIRYMLQWRPEDRMIAGQLLDRP
jgi:serine/threonine-protein kinase SRPK3